MCSFLPPLPESSAATAGTTASKASATAKSTGKKASATKEKTGTQKKRATASKKADTRKAEARSGKTSSRQGTARKAKPQNASPAKNPKNTAQASVSRSKRASSAKKASASRAAASVKATSAAKQTSSAKKRTQGRNIRSRMSSAAASGGNYKGAILYNVTARKTVFSQNPNVPVPPASLTKILSIYVAEDAIRARKINRFTKIVTVSPKAAAAGGSRMGLHAGQRVPLDALIRGMAVSSGNDASIAVAECIGGSEQKFVAMMNRKAREIGMKNSSFKNCNGLPARGQLTTPQDMLTLARRYMAAYPGNLDTYHRQNYFTYNGWMTASANPLLGTFKGADGLKTGFVSAAGYNLIATAERDNVRTIGVILGCPSSSVRARESTALMEAGFGRLACPIPPKNTKGAAEKLMADDKDSSKKETRTAGKSRPGAGKKQKKRQESTQATNSSRKAAAVKKRTPASASKPSSAPSQTAQRSERAAALP